MWNNKNNITSGLENIISFSRNITSHFTGKAKIITLVLIIIMLSFVNATFTSALLYQSNVGVGFTFNPTLSVNISPSNLVIDNLTPSITTDSNAITVSVATNAAYGYTLSATVNGGNNSNLTHTNGTSIFSSIATDASLSSLTNDNTWGYSYRLSNNSNNNAWSNYSGLSNETSKTLVNTDNQAAKPIDFKIAAKAAETQPSGAYTGTINFTAVSKPMPTTIQDIAYMQTFAELSTTDLASVKSSMVLNSAYILKDIRDEKEYYVTRLEDGNVWMTQNLDLDLSHNKPLTSNDTDLNDNTSTAYQDEYTVEGSVIYWTPASTANTINFEGTSVDGWVGSNTEPYSANKTDATETGHSSLGNYYNWTAAIASNDSSSLTQDTLSDISKNPKNSICPKGWRLPTISRQAANLEGSTNEFARLNYIYNNGSDNTNEGLIKSPLFMRGGYVSGDRYFSSAIGRYLSSTYRGSTYNYLLYFSSTSSNAGVFDSRGNYGSNIRCLAR